MKLVSTVVHNTGTFKKKEAPTKATVQESMSTEESLLKEQTNNGEVEKVKFAPAAYLPPTLSTPAESFTSPPPAKKPNLRQVLTPPPPSLITQFKVCLTPQSCYF